jgi:hypothetical protein
MDVRRQPIIIFNVSGKRYETTTASIELHPDTMLGMLLRHKSEDDYEIFIDRDSKIFRWILYWYRTGILVDHTTVKVPHEVWLHELSYYGIGEQEQSAATCLGEMSPKRRKLLEAEEELRQKAIALQEKSNQVSDAEAVKRRELYNKIIKYMMENIKPGDGNTWYDFVGFATGQTPQAYPYNYPVQFNPAWLKYWFDSEFRGFCASIGFDVKLIAYDAGSTKRKYDYAPGSSTDFRTKHASIRIAISIKKD